MEGTMAYLQIAAVVRWKVNELGKVVPDTTTPMSVVVQDTGNPDNRIIAAYIREELKKPGGDAEKLLKEAQEGLLTVPTTNKFEVTAPPLPAEYPQGPTAMIAKAVSDAVALVTKQLDELRAQGGGGQRSPQAGRGQQGQSGGGQPAQGGS
jgi:hypothetical protein